VGLAALLLVACAKDGHYDQEIDLLFNDPNKHYAIALDQLGDAGVVRPVNFRSRHVLLQISGAMVHTITIIVYDDQGTPVCSFDIDVSKSSESMPVIVEALCDIPDAGAPAVEASVPPDAELPPDTTPADTGPSPCQNYCAAMHQYCPMVYPTGDDDCLATCAAYGWLPEGTAVNSVACRRQRAIDSAIATDPLVPCYQAGPSGGRYCGKLCENYCEDAARACPDLEGDVNACELRCQEPVAHPAYRSETGNTLECRIFWLGEALKTSDRTICDRLREGAVAPLCHD
jgi:hypothetical protein